MDNKCFYCEREFNLAHYGTNKPLAQTKDHIIPISKGGNKGRINMVDCCTECNSFKGNSLLKEFSEKVKGYIAYGVGYKTIPDTRLYLIVRKAEELQIYVNEKGRKLFSDKKSAVDIMKECCADSYLSVNTNTPRRQSEEHKVFLSKQTVDQFHARRRLDAVVKKLLSAPAENFHYAD